MFISRSRSETTVPYGRRDSLRAASRLERRRRHQRRKNEPTDSNNLRF